MKTRSNVSMETFHGFRNGAETTQLLSEPAIQAGSRQIRRNLTLTTLIEPRM
jgi:hypothetical protein